MVILLDRQDIRATTSQGGVVVWFFSIVHDRYELPDRDPIDLVVGSIYIPIPVPNMTLVAIPILASPFPQGEALRPGLKPGLEAEWH
jgi:hypothetical protein